MNLDPYCERVAVLVIRHVCACASRINFIFLFIVPPRSPPFSTPSFIPPHSFLFSFLFPQKIMLHGPIDHRRRHHVNRQDNFLSRLFGVDTTDTTQATPTSIVDSPIAITVSVTSTQSSLASVTSSVALPSTCFCLARMLPN